MNLIGYFKDLNSEKKSFYMFLIIHLIVWTCVGLIRTVLPTDALEGIYWGSLHDFGTPKHPPLAGWLTYFAYIPFKSDFCIYLMSQLFITFGFIYIYKVAKKILSDTKAMLSVIILEGCWCYSYITGYYGFNPDVILLFILPFITYIFYNCMHRNKLSDWLKLGIIVGIAFMNKYQTAFFIIPMAIWAFLFNRKTFTNKYFYLSIIIALLLFSPHILWLIKYDFFPFMYFEGELTASSWLNHITAPLIFFLMQIVVISGTLLMYLLLRFKTKEPLTVIKDYKKEDLWFLLLLGFTPLLIHLLMGLFEGGTMRPRWGYEFNFLISIILLYVFPSRVETKEFKYILKSAYIIMAIIFLSLGGLLSIEKNYRSRYPVSTIYNDLNTVWKNQFGTDIKYLGGYIEWTLPLNVYVKSHPAVTLDTFGYKDPWIDEEDKKASGVLVIDRHQDELIEDTFKACPYLPKDYEVKPVEYHFEVTNFFKMPREYTIYYYMVPPMKNK